MKMQLAKKENKILYMIFLDIKKAYDSVDRDKLLTLLQNYGVGENICNIICNMWLEDIIVPKQKQYYGKPFLSSKGVKQGDIISPTIFNIVVDAVIRATYEKLRVLNKDDANLQFYADDGVICGEHYERVQHIMDIITQQFELFGLKMNVSKTESMTMEHNATATNMSEEAYNRRITGVGLSYSERQQVCVQC